MSKVLEKIIYKRVYLFLTNTNQLYQSQYGFRSKHSCEHAVQELLGNVLKAQENKKITAAIFLDLSKAFDSLEHDVLIQKLELYGIRGRILDWFQCYLSNRKMRVKSLNNNGSYDFSDLYDVNFSVPQGSCLGPLLFLVFCNDLPLNLTFCNAILFADDTTLYISHSNLRYLQWCICEELKQLSDWFMANKLTLNLGKSCCIIFGAGKRTLETFELKIENVEIPIFDDCKYLGVWIDKSLNWKKHVSTLQLKIKKNMHLLRACKNLIDAHSRIMVYHAHIQSHVIYCLSTWGNMVSNEQKKSIINLMQKCIKIIERTGITKSLVLDLNNLIMLENYKFGFKLVNNLLPEKILECVKTDQRGIYLTKKHRYSTRLKSILNLPKSTTLKYSKSIFCNGLRHYSKLTSNV